MFVVALQIVSTVFEIQKTVSVWPKDSRILKYQNQLLIISAEFSKYAICGVYLLVNLQDLRLQLY